MQIVTTINAVAPRTVNTRDGRSFELLEVHDGNGQAWVARQDVFNIASRLVGQQVELVGRIEQKGNYTNYFVDMVTPIGQGMQPYPANGQQQGMSMNPVAAAQQAGLQAGRVQATANDYVFTAKDHSIFRQTASKVAAGISDTPEQFWQNCADLARFYELGVTPRSFQQEGQLAGVAGTGGYQYTDDDIPF